MACGCEDGLCSPQFVILVMLFKDTAGLQITNMYYPIHPPYDRHPPYAGLAAWFPDVGWDL